MADVDIKATSSGDISNQDPQDIIIKYVKEKEHLKADLKEKEKEIQHYKAKVYDLTSKVDELQKQIKDLQKESSRQLAANNVRPTTSKARTPVMKRGKSSKPKTKGSNGSKSHANNPLPVENSPEPVSPVDMKRYQAALQAVDHFNDVAEKYPDLKLSVMLSSEKFFYECDTNNDGTIDEEELEKLLMKQGHICTDKELKEIMAQVDKDSNSAIDVMEYLAVMERVQQRKRVNLPTALTRSTTCVIQ